MASKTTKGYKVVQKIERGKTVVTLEPIPFYKKSASAQAWARKSKTPRAIRPAQAALHLARGGKS